jgi:hypothetical protein
MVRYPDHYEAPILELRRQSGTMGLGVAMGRILKIGVCQSGLRVGIMTLFGPFSRDFFVPWAEIAVVRKTYWIFGWTRLVFGNVGRLTVSDSVANQLWRANPDGWPEPGEPPKETRVMIFRRCATLWVAST